MYREGAGDGQEARLCAVLQGETEAIYQQMSRPTPTPRFQYSKSLTYEHSSCELSQTRTDLTLQTFVDANKSQKQLPCLPDIVTVLLCAYSAVH